MWTKGVKYRSEQFFQSPLRALELKCKQIWLPFAICLQFLISRRLQRSDFVRSGVETIYTPRWTEFVRRDQWFYAISHLHNNRLYVRFERPLKWRSALKAPYGRPEDALWTLFAHWEMGGWVFYMRVSSLGKILVQVGMLVSCSLHPFLDEIKTFCVLIFLIHLEGVVAHLTFTFLRQ